MSLNLCILIYPAKLSHADCMLGYIHFQRMKQIFQMNDQKNIFLFLLSDYGVYETFIQEMRY